MRALALSLLASLSLWLFQSFDLVAIAREFGFPIVVAAVMFVYFSRQITKKDGTVDQYREQTLKEAQSQSEYLKKLLAETRLQNVCRWNDSTKKEQ